MLPLTWQQNDLTWSLNVEWIIKNPLFYVCMDFWHSFCWRLLVVTKSGPPERNNRGVARGGAEGAGAPPEFGRSVNPI